MTAFMMIKKEFRELVATYKILFIPLVFTVLMITQPITMKMLPTLLENATDLPEGTVIEIPTPSAIEVLSTAVSKFNTLGTFVLIMVVMGAIAGERTSGVASMVFVKPVSRTVYYLSKVLTYFILTVGSIALAMAITAYYTEIMFGEINWSHVLQGTLLYIPNLLLVVIITLCASSFFQSSVTAGAVSLLFNLLLFTVPQFLGDFMKKVSPESLTNAAKQMIQEGSFSEAAFPSLISVSLLIIIFCFIGGYLLEKQEI